jgi:hypothetical protein
MLLPRWCIAYLGVPVSLILPHVQSLFPETLEQKALVSEALSMVICSCLGDSVFDTTLCAMPIARDVEHRNIAQRRSLNGYLLTFGCPCL